MFLLGLTLVFLYMKNHYMIVSTLSLRLNLKLNDLPQDFIIVYHNILEVIVCIIVNDVTPKNQKKY